jgi:phosphoribosyl-AMP cyclohydrolase
MAEPTFDKLKFDSNGLIPVVIQESGTGRVLMVAYMNASSLAKTLETGKTWFWSRSRQKYWLKGESSGNIQTVKRVTTDCDCDTVLIEVEQVGAACHEGFKSCFYRELRADGSLGEPIEQRLFDPAKVYGKK